MRPPIDYEIDKPFTVEGLTEAFREFLEKLPLPLDVLEHETTAINFYVMGSWEDGDACQIYIDLDY